MTLIWLGAFIVFLIIEGIGSGLICLWFAAGALIALLLSLLKASLIVQIIGFIVASALFVILLRPVAEKFINRKTTATNADRVVGKECIVTEDINNIEGKGRVTVGGEDWTARTVHQDEIIRVGQKVIAVKIQGAKLIVEKQK